MLFLKQLFLQQSFLSKSLSLSIRLNNRTLFKNVLSCPSGDIILPAVTVTEWVYSKMEPFYKFTAVECSEFGKKYTYEQVRVKAGNLSRALKKIWNLKNGDIIAVYLTNSPDFFVACLGIMEAGLVITTINSGYKSDEITKQLLDSSCKIIITEPLNFLEAKKASQQIRKNLPIICTKTRGSDSLPEGSVNFEELINGNIDLPAARARNSDDLVFLPYSSGTTGLPKGVEITNRNLVAAIEQNSHPDYTYVEAPSENFQDVNPAILPMFHIYGFMMNFLISSVTGMKILTFPRFRPETFISKMENHKISLLYAAPPLILFLTNNSEVKTKHLEHLKLVLCGAAPLGILDEQKFKQKAGGHVTLVQAYGLTEATGMVASLVNKKFAGQLDKYHGSIGRPVPSSFVKIIKPDDSSGQALGPNETGEILIKGPQIMRGYLNKPEETEKLFLDGWFRSGDIGHYNEESMLFVTDRLKELIKVKGFQVAPAELEELIRDFPAVQDAAVIGVPHSTFGEVPRAYVVRKEGKRLKPEDIQEYVAVKLAKYKHLVGGVEIVQTIPKTASGKILRKELQQNFQERLKK